MLRTHHYILDCHSQMKQEHQDGQIKIRALQRENANMQHELQQCAKMFKDANATFKSKFVPLHPCAPN